MGRDITASNATAILTVESLFPNGFKLQQFSTDTFASTSDDTYAETRMGIDLQMVAGYVDQIKTVTITLEPSSPSVVNMNHIIAASRANKRIYLCQLLISLPSISRGYQYTNGVLKTGKFMPDIKKVLDPIQYTFDFEKVKSMDISAAGIASTIIGNFT